MRMTQLMDCFSVDLSRLRMTIDGLFGCGPRQTENDPIDGLFECGPRQTVRMTQLMDCLSVGLGRL